MKTKYTVPALGLVSLLTAAFLQADVVFSFGLSDSYVTSNQNLTGGNDVTAISGSVISPTSNYTGPAFIGGRDLTGGTAGTWAINESTGDANSNGNHDSISASVNSANGEAQYLFFAFEQDQFESGFSSGNIGLDASSTFTITARRTGGQDSGVETAGLRWVIRENGTYYASELNNGASFSGGIDQPQNTITQTNPTALSWYQYDPESNVALSSEVAASPGFSQVDAFGVYYVNTRATGSNFLNLNITQLELNATAIPEPGTLSLLLLSGIALALARRRRH